jgi:hypothetical protein
MVRTDGDDREEQQIIADVERVGWHLVGVEAQDAKPGFVYSVGLYHTFQQPEIVLFGLDRCAVMFDVINNIAEAIRQGASVDDWYESREILPGKTCMFRSFEREVYAEYLGDALWFYEGLDFPALQCVWPDDGGCYPWESECAVDQSARQPVFTQRIGWPFHEGKNRAVFTTRQVLEGRQVVLVTHDAAGDWQFLCGTTDRSEDGRLVSLETIVENHPSILELVDLPVGWQAIRESPDRPWQRMRY